MKKFYILCCLVIATFCLNAQLVINEIMYNPPEAGNDSLEFIEILNNGTTPYNMEGVSFKSGVAYTFKNYILGPGKVVVVAVDSVALKTVLNVDAFQSVGALSNSGEGISIADAAGTILDELMYDDAAPWPTEPDDLGPSLVLCDPNSNNSDGANWKAAKNSTGVFINGKEIKASPGQLNVVSCEVVPSVFIEVKNFSFTPKDITIDPGTTVRWTNTGGTHNVNGTQAIFANNPESFGNGPAAPAGWTYDYTFTKSGLYTYQCDPHAPNMKGTVTVKGVVKNYLPYTIAKAKLANADGKLDSLGKFAEISGIVHGTNLRPGSLQFVLIDASNNGIGVFNATSDLAYQVKEGDVISIKGALGQFNGYAQILAEIISKKGTDNPVAPKVVSTLIEADESSMVKLNNLNYVDVTEWKTDGSTFNFNVTDGANTFVVRIDNDNELSKMTAPKAPFKITGWVNQNDVSSPFTEGYQLMPRYAADIESIVATNENDKISLSVYPNPTNGEVFFNSDQTINQIDLFNMQGINIQTIKAANKIDLTNRQKGIYLAKITFGTSTKVVKIYKQ